MGRILRFRRSRTGIPEFEEALARLSEELALTERFAEQMIRDGHYKAAAGVVAEQERRVAEHAATMSAALRPRQRRTQYAAGGIAAVMLVGTASFTALIMRAEDANSTPAVMQRVQSNLERAVEARTEANVEALLSDAARDITAIGPDVAADPKMRGKLRGLLNSQLDALLAKRPHLRPLVDRLASVAETSANVKVDPDVEEPAPNPPAHDETTPPPAPSATP